MNSFCGNGSDTRRNWGFGDLGSTTFSNDGVDYIVELVWRVKITDLADNGVFV